MSKKFFNLVGVSCPRVDSRDSESHHNSRRVLDVWPQNGPACEFFHVKYEYDLDTTMSLNSIC